MAIQIERNENGNCVNFRGATQPVYWNNCLTAVAVGTDRINIENDIRSAGAGQTYYEYFNVKIEDFCDNNGASFANATAAASYINGVAKATPSGVSSSFPDNSKLTFGDDDDLEIFHNSSNGNTIIQENTDGNFVIKGTNLFLQSRNSEDFFKGDADGAVTLFYDDTEKFKTTGYGVTIVGGVYASGISTFANVSLGDDDVLSFGDGDDLQIIHNGTASFIKDVGTGSLIIQGNNIRLQNASSSGTALQVSDGSAQLYNNNSKKLETIGTGVTVFGDAYIGSDNSAGVIQTSPNGTAYRLTVANDGTLSTTAV